MNKKQKFIMWVGVILVVGMLLVPPWIKVTRDNDGKVMARESVGLIRTETPSAYRKISWYIDFGGLFLQVAAVSLLTAALIYSLKSKKP